MNRYTVKGLFPSQFHVRVLFVYCMYCNTEYCLMFKWFFSVNRIVKDIQKTVFLNMVNNSQPLA